MVLDKEIIEKFLQKDVKITAGVVGYQIKGKITGIDDLGVLLLDKNMDGPMRYFPIFNIIEIEEIEKNNNV